LIHISLSSPPQLFVKATLAAVAFCTVTSIADARFAIAFSTKDDVRTEWFRGGMVAGYHVRGFAGTAKYRNKSPACTGKALLS
jgi:hypothetical protein